jgi:hypothetical protein
MDEVVDGTLGTVKVGFGKIMDGTLDSTNKLIVNSSGEALVKNTTGDTSLASIDGKITAVNTGAVVVSSSALPTLAATSTKQSDGTQQTKLTNGTIVVDVKTLGTQVTSTDNGLVVNAVMHGITTAGGGSYVDVKVNPSGAVSVDASGSTLAANSGVDIGDVTINNAAGAAAVNIQDGGNSITVDGTVAISGSVAVTNAGTFVTQLNDGTNTANTLKSDATAAGQNSLMIAGAYLSTAFTTTTVQAVGTTDAGNYRWVSVQVANQGTSSTVNFQVSNDNTNWTSHYLTPAASSNGSSTFSSTNTVSLFHGPLPARYFRLNVTGISAGTTSGTIIFNTVPSAMHVLNTTTNITGTVTTKETRSATPTQTSVSVTTASTSILASNANRLGATITNEGTAICYTKLGATASVTSYSIQIASGGYYEVPFQYTGAIDGITSASTAQLRITEIV